MATPIEQFILDNASRHQKLVHAFKPDTKSKPKTATQTNPDVVVCARVRPLLEHEASAGITPGVFVRTGTTNVADVHELRQMVRGPPNLKSSSFEVDRCYGPDVPTNVIHDNLIKELVPWAWAGGIATLFAYGQTGSGKTYTVSQIERLVAAQLMDGKLQGKRKVHVTIVELSGSSAYDLLNSRKAVSILEDSFGVTQIAGAAEHEVHTTDELLDYIENAATFRRTEATVKNDSSSRSHAICRIRMENPSAPADEDGMLYMVDLAGSEAARDRAQHDPERMRESRHINTSLSVLKDCIRGRAEADMAVASGSKKKPYVPFRQSSLTKVLKHVFDPSGTRSCRTVVIACVNPSLLDLVASRNTLRYAEMLRVLMPKNTTVKYDPASPATWSNQQIQAWVTENSGSPPIDGTILAPTESGSQLLRLPPADFEARCLKSPGVKPEQARVFRSKLWQHHVDSQASAATKNTQTQGDGSSMGELLLHMNSVDRSSSRHPDPQIAKMPFKERIRPGMVISFSTRDGDPGYMYGVKMAYILGAASAAGSHATDLNDDPVATHKDVEGPGEAPSAYLCATVNPGVLHESYEIQLWRHIVIGVDRMDTEILLEYDPGTRYHFMTL